MPRPTSPGKAFGQAVVWLGWMCSVTLAAGMDLPVLQRAAGSYPVFTTLSELQQHSTLVVVATPLKPFVEGPFVMGSIPHVQRQLVVQKVLQDHYGKKFKKGTVIEVLEPAAIGMDGGRKVMYSMDVYVPMQFGRTYVVFLQKSGVKGFWSIVNMNLSRFPVDGGTLQGVYRDEKEFRVAKGILKQMRLIGFYP